MVKCEADFKKAKKFNKDVTKDIVNSINGFMENRQEFLVERCQANCPVKTGRLRKSIKGKKVVKSKGCFEGEICTEGCDYALRVHEAPRKRSVKDVNTPEGGQGNKFISRPMEYHFSKTNEEALQDYINKKYLEKYSIKLEKKSI